MSMTRLAFGLEIGDEVVLTGESWKSSLKGETRTVDGSEVPAAEGYTEAYPYFKDGDSKCYIYKIGDVDYSATLLGDISTPPLSSGSSQPVATPSRPGGYEDALKDMEDTLKDALVQAALDWAQTMDEPEALSRSCDDYINGLNLIDKLRNRT